MPRRGRIDYPGALHHVISRGNERKEIFRDDGDRKAFLRRLGALVKEGKGACHAWCLMPNHIHLLLETQDLSVSRLMQDLLTGYAVTFNAKYGRSGHLFQGRFKSVLCQSDRYLKDLVRYIHLNPLKSELVKNMKELEFFRWAGHGRILGGKEPSWQDTGEVLAAFGRNPEAGRKEYLRFMTLGWNNPQEVRIDLSTGVRRGRGTKDLARRNRWDEKAWDRERILGDEGFVARAMERGALRREKRRRAWKKGLTLEKVLERAGALTGVAGKDLVGGSKEPARSHGRAIACYWLVKELGHRAVDVAKWLDITQSAVSHGIKKGAAMATERRLKRIS